MEPYQRSLIKDSDCFIAQNFPFLAVRLQQLGEQTKHEPPGAKTDMLLSFVKDNHLDSELVMQYPQLALQISSRSLPFGELEDLFEASRNNPSFRTALEAYVKTVLYLAAGRN